MRFTGEFRSALLNHDQSGKATDPVAVGVPIDQAVNEILHRALKTRKPLFRDSDLAEF